MRQDISYKAATAVLLAWLSAAPDARAGEQAKSIVNSLDPKGMNDLFEALPRQPDAALTNIVPVSPNKFRYIFVWPDTNTLMTYDRVSRSFADRFLAFAEQLKPLAKGYCLPAEDVSFGTTAYGEEEVNVAFREIEVRYQFGWQPPCQGRYLKAAEVEQLAMLEAQRRSYGVTWPSPGTSGQPRKETPQPGEELKPFLNSPPAAPPLE